MAEEHSFNTNRTGGHHSPSAQIVEFNPNFEICAERLFIEKMAKEKKFQENVLLARYSHYKIGGAARFFFIAKSIGDVQWAIKEAKSRRLPIFVLGGGTNLLIGDEGFDGLVLKLGLDSIKVSKNVMTVDAGAMVSGMLKATVARSLSGLEWAGGLPGTVGGAIRGNAGCFGGEIKDSIVAVTSFDMKKMSIVKRSAARCAFGYRDSIFKKKNGMEIILSVTFKLKKGEKYAIARAIKEKIEYRKKHHPMEYPNIGSIFKNIPVGMIHKKGSSQYKEAIARALVVHRGSQFSVKTDPQPVLSAAKFISEAGLRGVSFGGAMISPKHPNFIVNVLTARAEDVKGLIFLAKAEVARKFGVALEEEVQIV